MSINDRFGEYKTRCPQCNGKVKYWYYALDCRHNPPSSGIQCKNCGRNFSQEDWQEIEKKSKEKKSKKKYRKVLPPPFEGSISLKEAEDIVRQVIEKDKRKKVVRKQPVVIWQTSGKEFSDKDLADINSLLGELSSHPQTVAKTDLARVLEHGRIATVRDSNRIVGMATLCTFHTLHGSIGRIEDVVVAKSHRGHNLGKRLMASLISLAKAKGLRYLELTNWPRRLAANALYKKLGFVMYPTNYYRLYL